MAGYTLHVISHSHWDREWYLPFERHRRRLVKLLDDLLAVLERDPEFGSFHLDGQSLPLEDYLAIRPHQRQRLVAAAQAGRLTVGPWYVLQDEYLTSAEAQVRNLLYGTRVAAQFGAPLKVGYLADAFGNIGQMPGLLRGFGIDNAVFGRGLNRLNPDADPNLPDGERGYHSEVCWRGGDGSEVLGIFMANWYSNAMDIPSDPDACVGRFEAIRDAAAKLATTEHLLLMNGCDHTPCQLNLSELIRTARERLDDTIQHSRLDDYAAAVRAAAGALQQVTGELRSEYTDGWGTLTNVLSARLYLKQANYRCQLELERYLEPLQAVGALWGQAADRDFRAYLWKLLLQNHPHDSICGCSCDEVHREMETRFAKVEQLAGQLSGESLEAVAAEVDTRAAPAGAVPLVVYNPLAHERCDLVRAEVSFPLGTTVRAVKVTAAADGSDVPYWIERTWRKTWDYELPDDRFRQPYECQRGQIAFLARVPAFGYATFWVQPAAEARPEGVASGNQMENDALRVTIHSNGSFDVLDKETGRWFRDLNVLTYGQDVGDEYIYRAPEGDEEQPIAEASLDEADDPGAVVSNPVYQVYGGEETLIVHPEGNRPPQVIRMPYRIMLPREGRRVEVSLKLFNFDSSNFRIRAWFATDTQATTVLADGQFEVVERPVEPWHGWTNPSNCQPCQAFVTVADGTAGLTVANRGLPEYEVLRDGRHTLAVTLLRAVDRLGDWGVFPTPDAQCQRENVAEYAVIPHGPDPAGTADLAARAYAAPLRAVQTGTHGGRLPVAAAWLELEPAWLTLSAVRWAEDRDAFLVRFYNPYDRPVSATLRCRLPVSRVWRCNLDEVRGELLGEVGDGLRLAVGAKEMVTLELG